jgi:hypothetical protein
VVQDESGSVYRRNRKQIISVPKDGDHTLQPKAVVAPELSPDLMPDSILMDPPEPTIRRSQRLIKKPDRFIESY